MQKQHPKSVRVTSEPQLSCSKLQHYLCSAAWACDRAHNMWCIASKLCSSGVVVDILQLFGCCCCCSSLAVSLLFAVSCLLRCAATATATAAIAHIVLRAEGCSVVPLKPPIAACSTSDCKVSLVAVAITI
eukprot:15305-Heterococcus_DN1.PRE.3